MILIHFKMHLEITYLKIINQLAQLIVCILQHELIETQFNALFTRLIEKSSAECIKINAVSKTALCHVVKSLEKRASDALSIPTDGNEQRLLAFIRGCFRV